MATTSEELVSVTEDELQRHADGAIAWQGKTVELFIGQGAYLAHRNDTLPYGQFVKLFKDHPNHVPRPVPFSLRTAQRLMAVARHPVLSDTRHMCRLPACWGTLYVLSALHPTDLERTIKDGMVHPELGRREAEAIVANVDDGRSVRRVADTIDKIIEREAPHWASRRVRVLAERLRSIADALDEGVSARERAMKELFMPLPADESGTEPIREPDDREAAA